MRPQHPLQSVADCLVVVHNRDQRFHREACPSSSQADITPIIATASTGRGDTALPTRNTVVALWCRRAGFPDGCCSGHSTPAPASGNVKPTRAPWRVAVLAHKEPPCASMIERLIASPTPIPSGFVV